MADLFDGYPLGEQWDEMFSAPGQPRVLYMFSSLQPMSGEELAARADVLSQTYCDAGVTFAHAGEEQPFPLDIVPRVIGHEEWSVIERGVTQRVRALEAPWPTSTAPVRSSPTGSCRAAWSPPVRTSIGPRTGWSRPTASGCTSAASTWCATRPVTSGCWRTTSGRPRGSAT